MLAIGIGESKYSSSEFALEDSWENPIKEVNHSVYNLFQGEREGFSLASPDEEAIDHLLVEQHGVGTLDDDVMYSSSRSLENCLRVGGTSFSTVCCDRGNDYGILDADAEEVGKHALKYEFTLQGAEETENIHATCNLSCDCSDFLLESGSAESLLLDYPSNNEVTVVDMKSAREIQCPVRSSDEVKSDFPYIDKKFTITELDHTTVPQYSLGIHESHDGLQSTDSLNVSFEDQKWLKHGLSFDQQNLTGLANVSDLMESVFLSIENEDGMILIPGDEMPKSVCSSVRSISPGRALVAGTTKDDVPHVDVQTDLIEVSHYAQEISEETHDSFISTKRLRKPTRRYIEETSEIQSKCSYERLNISLLTSKEKLLHARTEEKYHWGGAVQLLNQDYPCRLQSLGERRRKTNRLLGRSDGKRYVLPSKTTALTIYESEVQEDTSDESTTTYCQKRKHHRQWTISEVVRLVDGVSRFGVGKWTEIKRMWFSASAYRTAVDLKDKWRNLLRASVADSENRNLVEAQQKKHASAFIPPSVLQRVRELSIIHPYPRSQRLRIADLPTASPPTSGRRRQRNRDASVSLRSRIIRRRSSSQ